MGGCPVRVCVCGGVFVYTTHLGVAAFLDDIMIMKQSARLIHPRQKETFWDDKRKHKGGDNNIIHFKLYICPEGS